MFTHPDLMWAQYNQHRSDLIAEADTYRLLAAARRARRERRSEAGSDGRPNNPVVKAQPTRNLAASAPRTAARAR